MARYSVLGVLVLMGLIGPANAGHFHLYYPRPVMVAPVMAWQPAYVVPVATYAVTAQVPVTTVTYATSYYAPLVPVVSVAPVVYPVPAYVGPVYSMPVYSAPIYGGYGYYGNSVRSRLNVHRNGSYNYHLRVR
jgi:hypothetical protein